MFSLAKFWYFYNNTIFAENNYKVYDNNNNDRRMESVYSKRVRAGKRRTYFFDVKATRSSDYYLVITESCKRFEDNSYDKHKIFLYKEDFNKFLKSLSETIEYVKTDLMPDFDFDAFSHEFNENYQEQQFANPDIQPDNTPNITSANEQEGNNLSDEPVDKW